ncbi:MAG: aldo/keto reductase [Candidatus Kariarchaeaceae archaeon]
MRLLGKITQFSRIDPKDRRRAFVKTLDVDIAKCNLGKTDIKITPIGLGVWQFGGGSGFTKFIWSGISLEEKNNIIKQAIEGGINWFDTAEAYGRGKSEQALSLGLQEANQADHEVIVATKWFPLFKTAKSIKRTIKTRLEKLHPYSIDLHQVHQPISFSSVRAQMNAMADLVDEKKIRSVGISNFSADKMRKSEEYLEERRYCLASNQVRYNLLDRSIESNGILDTAKELGITIIAYSPIAMGLLSGKFHKDSKLIKTRPFARRQFLKRKIDQSKILIDELENIANDHEVTIAQVALNWLINFHGDTVVAIPGASKLSHVKESAGVMQFKLSKNELDSIDELTTQWI